MTIKTDAYSVQEFKQLQHEEFAFMTCASFEERVFSVPQCFANALIKKSYVFATNATDKIVENCATLQQLLGKNALVKNITKNDPFSYIRCFNEAISETIFEGCRNLYIDITTFNHEMLLILLKAIDKKKELFTSIKFLYNGAKEYSIGDKSENKWLCFTS